MDNQYWREELTEAIKVVTGDSDARPGFVPSDDMANAIALLQADRLESIRFELEFFFEDFWSQASTVFASEKGEGE